MKKRLVGILIFVGGMVLLQQMAVLLGEHQPTFRAQKELIINRDMDPAIFFYTESEEALKAEKQVRSKMEQLP